MSSCDAEPWGDCRLGLADCYGRKAPGVCTKIAQGDHRYEALARRLTADGDRVAGVRRRQPGDIGPIRAVALMAACWTGGAEDATETMIRATQATGRIRWLAAVASDPSLVCQKSRQAQQASLTHSKTLNRLLVLRNGRKPLFMKVRSYY
jgi:hypothetical protein